MSKFFREGNMLLDVLGADGGSDGAQCHTEVILVTNSDSERFSVKRSINQGPLSKERGGSVT